MRQPPSPFDPLLPLLEAARKMGVTPWGWPVFVEVTFSGGMKVPLPVTPIETELVDSNRDHPPLSAKQKRILVALLDGPMKGESLAAAVGLLNRSSLVANHGTKELIAWGLIVNSEENGYELTEAGEDLATAVSEG